jgi:hypothetical protein
MRNIGRLTGHNGFIGDLIFSVAPLPGKDLRSVINFIASLEINP